MTAETSRPTAMTDWRQGRMLFVSNVGSHLWGMNRPDSDLDLFVCYQAPSKDILLGRRPVSQHVQTIENGQKIDRAIHELGHVVDQLLKGNVNFLWGVFSPKVESFGSFSFQKFRDLAWANLSRRVYHSVRGLAFGNWKKYVESGRDPSEKRCNIIARTIFFGIGLLARGTIEFASVRSTYPGHIPFLIEQLDDAYQHSVLPDVPSKPHFLTDFLFKQRLTELETEGLNMYGGF